MDLLIDMATLTGAQLTATGTRHAGIVTNSDALERTAVLTGRLTGDLVHPLPFCPEFHRQEFASKVCHELSLHLEIHIFLRPYAACLALLTPIPLLQVADMKNDVREPRMNALASCAANFIHENIAEGWAGEWLHIDCAGPAFVDARGTGYGVALVLGLLGVAGFRGDR